MTPEPSQLAPDAPGQHAQMPRRRKWLRRLAWGLAGLLLVLAVGVGALVFQYKRIVSAKPGQLATPLQPGEFGRWVNPFIGTGGYPWVCGNNFPGAMVPFGMVRLGPETVSWLGRKRALNTSGYYYADNRVLGFSHTRLNGTGATDGGHFLVVPSFTAIPEQGRREGRARRFSHRQETASPGYYAVELPELGALVELTATARVGVHRYTFRRAHSPHLWLDVANALGGKPSREANVRVLPETGEVEGSVRTFGTFASRYGGVRVYFVARFDPPFVTFRTWSGDAPSADPRQAEGVRVGADLGFASTKPPVVVVLKLAISYVSIANARANLEAEAAEKSFDTLAAEARQAWEERLARIELEGGTPEQRTIFYTALYRVFQMPTLFQDANGEFIGFDRQVHRAEGFRYYTDLSLWDTFRTVHPFYTLIAPEDHRDMLVSLVTMLTHGGWLPRWPSGHGYSNSMLGTPADIVLAEAWLKGIRDFDIEKAYAAMRRTALAPTPPGAPFSGREGIADYLQYGYCPSDRMKESVARTFEFCWADHAIAGLAEALGKAEDAARFRKHAQFYRNLWNPQTQYFQPRDSQGRFCEPFGPLRLTYFERRGGCTEAYVEGSALQWRWGAPFDAAGMIALFKSREFLVEELNRFFAQSHPARGRWNPGPYYWHGNQPDLHAAYLFNDAGRPDLTQKWVRWILDHKYGTDHAGLDGNDDGGTLSAWYVFSALGLYPVAGTDRYQLGAPLFPRARVRLKGQPLVVLAENAAPNHPYVQQVWLNDTPLERPSLRHAEIQDGGVLRFVMGAGPVRP